MAFVERSERKITYSPLIPNMVGPGQYLGQDILKPKHPSQVPFNSYTYRDTNVTKNDNPGPGSYEKDENAQKFAHILYNRHLSSTVDPLIESINRKISSSIEGSIKGMIISQTKKKLGFLSAEKRFPIDLNSFETPGPGQYQPKSSYIMESIPKTHENTNVNRKITSANQVPSIPSQAQSYGYDYTNNGVLSPVEDPDKFEKFKGTKNDSVGPGRYDLDNAENWKKNVLDWRRISIDESKHNNGNDHKDKICDANTSVQVSNAIHSNLNSHANISDYSVYNTTEAVPEKKRKNLNRRYQQALKKRRDLMVFHNHNEGNNLIEETLFSESPGPGYYYKDIFQYENMKYPNQFQTFGSNSPRFSDNVYKYGGSSSPGPGQYFIDNKGSHKRNSIYKNFSLNIPGNRLVNAEKKSNIVKEGNTSIVGPGYYDLTEHFVKKPVSQISHFGFLARRFPEENKSLENSPGPGSYIAQQTWRKLRNKEKVTRIIREDPDRSVISKEKSSIPPVGSYNSDCLKSIQYQVALHSNQFQSNRAPFSSMENRFKSKKANVNDNVGPGCYYNQETKAPAQNSLPFLVGSKRLSNKTDHEVGPGMYNRDSYFDWNKRSFNMLFI